VSSGYFAGEGKKGGKVEAEGNEARENGGRCGGNSSHINAEILSFWTKTLLFLR
jgi:hypothetical protein